MLDEDKPFVCSQPGCGMQFTNEDHLSVHMRKHDMSLALNLTPGGLSPLGLFTDQTPTPTKFLRNCEELGLFQELSKNPFDDSFKKAMDDPIDHSQSLHLPATDSADLDTPQPPIPKIVIGGEEMHEIRKHPDKPKDMTMSSIVPKKRKKFLSQSLPTSTTSDDEDEAVIGSSSSSSSMLNGSSTNINVDMVPVHVTSSVPVQATRNVSVRLTESSRVDNTEPVLYSAQPIHSTGSNANTDADDALVPEMSSPNINMISIPISSMPTQNTPTLAASPLMVQVLLQLPGGQVVPVQVPASNIANNQLPIIQAQQPGIQLYRPAAQTQQPTAHMTQNSSVILTGNNTILQTGQNPQMVAPGGIIQNTVPFTVTSPQQASNPQTGLQTILNQSGTQSTIQTLLNRSGTHPTLQTVLNQSNAQSALQTVLNQSALQTVVNQSGTQSALRTILVTNKQTGMQTVTPQNSATQAMQNVIAMQQSNTKLTQKVAVPGSQSYTKQRLKAAIQQQTTPSSSQKYFQVAEVKSEPQWSPVMGTVYTSGAGSSPEAGLSPGISGSMESYEQSMSEFGDTEYKREKFLERNRAAAARCRQKRKYWVQTLERKAENLSTVNNKLCGEIKKLRGEVASLKTMLLAHKDCPVTMRQRSQGQIASDMLALEALSDITPIIIDGANSEQTLCEVSEASNNHTTMATVDQSGSHATIPIHVGLVQNLIQGDQIPLSVITGSNSLALIPKIVNLNQTIQTAASSGS